MDNDFFLILRIKSGDEIATQKIVEKYYSAILQYCKYHIPSKEDAEDITQETFERFFYNLEKYKHQGKIINYLYVIAGNLCKDFYKKQEQIKNFEIEREESNISANIEEKLDIDNAINMLSSEQKEVVILYYFQGLKLKEISEILNIKLPLVKYRIKEAKIRLEEFLGKESK